jgi:hypothetical protein
MATMVARIGIEELCPTGRAARIVAMSAGRIIILGQAKARHRT